MFIRRIRMEQKRAVSPPYIAFLAYHACELVSIEGQNKKSLISRVTLRESAVENVFVTDIHFECREDFDAYNTLWADKMRGEISKWYPDAIGPDSPFLYKIVIHDTENPETTQNDFELQLSGMADCNEQYVLPPNPLKAPGVFGLFDLPAPEQLLPLADEEQLLCKKIS